MSSRGPQETGNALTHVAGATILQHTSNHRPASLKLTVLYVRYTSIEPDEKGLMTFGLEVTDHERPRPRRSSAASLAVGPLTTCPPVPSADPRGRVLGPER